jgi:hypothetical protein
MMGYHPKLCSFVRKRGLRKDKKNINPSIALKSLCIIHKDFENLLPTANESSFTFPKRFYVSYTRLLGFLSLGDLSLPGEGVHWETKWWLASSRIIE